MHADRVTFTTQPNTLWTFCTSVHLNGSLCPVDIIETDSQPADNHSSPESTPSPSPSTSNSGQVEHNNSKETAEPSDDTDDREDNSASLSYEGSNGTKKERLAVRGVQSRRHMGRKRKAEASMSDSGLQAYIVQQTKQL
ncbi:hypothetical protein ILYODFUR_026804 [Ilyodon furcidens]|uniref:Uncharacterized protein n=1 Tax=Ilyodon furcidens TaxID=33524 RepID=A0ABV0V6D7_9TELE